MDERLLGASSAAGARLTRRGLLGLGAAAVAGGVLGPRARAQEADQAEWQRWVDAGWEAWSKDRDYQRTADCFMNARRCGRLREWEYHVLAQCFAKLRDPRNAVLAGEESCQVHRNADALATLAIARFMTGDAPTAQATLAEACGTPGADREHGPLGDAYSRLATWHLRLSVYQDWRDMTEAGQGLYRRNGCYTCYLPRTEKFQSVICEGTTGAEHIDEWSDENDNRAYRIRATNDGHVETTFQVVRSAWWDVPPLGDDTYEVPDSVRKYLGKTQSCDPTTELVSRAAEPLRGETRLETVENVRKWWSERLRGIVNGKFAPRQPGEPASEYGLRQIENEGFCNLTCAEEVMIASALLRRLGIASTRVFAFYLNTDTGKVDHGHEWPVYYEPEVGWISIWADVGEWPMSVLFYRGDSREHDALMGTEVPGSGAYWWQSTNGPKGDAYHYRVPSFERRP